MNEHSNKSGAITIFNTLKDTFPGLYEKFKYTSKEEREDFFAKNNLIDALYWLFIPQTVLVRDINKTESLLPYQIFIDKNFLIDIDSRIISDALDIITWNDLIKDEFFIFGKTVELLDLTEDDQHYIYYSLFCDLLNARIKVYNKNQTTYPLHHQEVNNDMDIYSSFIDLNTVTVEYMKDIEGQIIYFDKYADKIAWRDLLDEVSYALREAHSSMLNGVTILLSEPSEQNFNYISTKLFTIESLREARSRLNRNTHKEYDEYTISQLKRSRDHLTSLSNFRKRNQTNISMGDVYNTHQAGSVGPHSKASNNTLNSITYSLPENLDYNALKNELTQLRDESVKDAKLPEHYTSIAEVVQAIEAAERKDNGKLIEHLKNAGPWILQKIQEIGVSVLSNIISSQLGS